MRKIKTYHDAFFLPEVLAEATKAFEIFASAEKLAGVSNSLSGEITKNYESWSYYNNIDEFMADYRKSPWHAVYRRNIGILDFEVTFNDQENSTVVRVDGFNKPNIESVFNVFEKHYSSSKRPREIPKQETRIFIGHGHSSQWKDLKDHLHDKHDYNIEAYEIGARAGHTIRDILEEMLTKSSFAILVMTGEDEDKNGSMHPRDNVIHELGLFQGHLGFSKAIVLLEAGTEEFSNIHGIHQIRYSKNNIKETFGEVVATINREFKEKIMKQ